MPTFSTGFDSGSAYPVKCTIGLVGTLVVAALLSAAAYVCSEPVQARGTLDIGELDVVGSGLPTLPSYNLDPDITYNVRQALGFLGKC